MMKIFNWVLLTAFFLMSCASPPRDRLKRITVYRIVDGDTFDARMEDGSLARIRLKYIDAPELFQDSGIKANDVLDSLIGNREVLFDEDSVLSYGRKVGVVYNLTMSGSVNEFMVRRGMAWAYKKYVPKQLYQDMLTARVQKKGIWASSRVEPPFIYRQQLKIK